MENESDRLSRLKPIGELKVTHIPLSSPEHYAFTVQPGNSVWGNSWKKQNTFDRKLINQETLERKD